MKIYLIPGLGYDCRIFERLDLSNFEVVELNWIDPEPKENIANYAKRLFASIDDQAEEPIVLIGHSFGAVVAQEIAQFKKIDLVVVLSSIKTRDEIPFFFKSLPYFKLHRIFTKELSIKSIKYWGKSHGFTAPQDIELFKSMVGSYSNNYLQWALKALTIWKGVQLPEQTQLLQIHGDQDKTFPIKKIQSPYIEIKTGSHIMVYKQPEKINAILLDTLKAQ